MTQALNMVRQDPAAARAALANPETYYRTAVEITLALET
jgi:hypothetical protein